MGFPLDDTPFSLSREAIKAILDAQKDSKEDEMERGFFLCRKNATLYPGTHCIGSLCGVVLRDCAVMDMPQSGLFHTHGATTAWPSAGDLLNSFYHALTAPDDQWIDIRSGGEGVHFSYIAVTPEHKDLFEEIWGRLHRMYREKVKPAYDVWEKTGVMPENGAWANEDFIRNKLEKQLFISHLIAIPRLMLFLARPDVVEVTREQVLLCDELYRLDELKTLARRHGLSASGDKKTLCRRLVAEGVLH